MSALSDEIREAVQVALAELLPGIVETAMVTAAAKLQLGDAGDELLDAEAYGRMVGKTAAAVRRAEERGTGVVPAVRIGRSLRWRKRDILAFRAAQAAEAR